MLAGKFLIIYLFFLLVILSTFVLKKKYKLVKLVIYFNNIDKVLKKTKEKRAKNKIV